MTSRYRWVILATGAVGAGAFSALRMGLPSLAPALRGEFGLSLGEVGLAFAAVTGGGMLTLVPWGALTDRIGERPVMASGLAGCAAALVGAALSTTYARAPRRPVRRRHVRLERHRRLGPRGHGLVRAHRARLRPRHPPDGAAARRRRGLSDAAEPDRRQGARCGLRRPRGAQPDRRRRVRRAHARPARAVPGRPPRAPPARRRRATCACGASARAVRCSSAPRPRCSASSCSSCTTRATSARRPPRPRSARCRSSARSCASSPAGARTARACASRPCGASPRATRCCWPPSARWPPGPRVVLYPLLAVAAISTMSWNGLAFTAAAEISGLARAGTAMSLQNTLISVGGVLAPTAFGVLVEATSWTAAYVRPRARAARGLRRAAPARGRRGRPHRSPRAPRARDPRTAPRGGDMTTDVTEVQSGLEGVVAFATEIAEPDREGGALRYRGVDIEELVGSVPYEKVWGLLVDGDLRAGLAAGEPHPLTIRSGDPRVDVQSGARDAGAASGASGQLIDISDEQARDDLARASVDGAELRGAVRARRGPPAGPADRGRPRRPRRPSASSSAGAARRTPTTPRPSTRTGSRPPSTA